MRSSAVRVLCLMALLAGALPAHAHGPSFNRSSRAVTLAVIGDTPYGAAQVQDFPNFVQAINADPDVERVVHIGDIKNGSTRCDTEYFELISDHFDDFEDPLVYTPGDNEWTDCHRSNNGKYDPLDRLEALRDIFFATPYLTLGGQQVPLFTQALVPGYRHLPENQMWVDARTVFATMHVVGSRNNLAPWFTDDTTDAYEDDPARREADVAERTAATLDWIDRVFDLAAFPSTPSSGGRGRFFEGVVIFMHADTWPGASADDGFGEILQAIAERAAAFQKPVLVIQGDSHSYLVDQPLLDGDAVHGIDISVPNLTRLVVEGATTSEYLKLTIDPKADQLFSWERISL